MREREPFLPARLLKKCLKTKEIMFLFCISGKIKNVSVDQTPHSLTLFFFLPAINTELSVLPINPSNLPNKINIFSP